MTCTVLYLTAVGSLEDIAVACSDITSMSVVLTCAVGFTYSAIESEELSWSMISSPNLCCQFFHDDALTSTRVPSTVISEHI